MKKYTLIVTFIASILLQSCVVEPTPVVNNSPDYDTISEVFEYSNVNFTNSNNFNVILDFPYSVYTSDMVLVYRLSDYYNGTDIWSLLPETHYYNGAFDFSYSNDATRYDASVFMNGYDLGGIPPEYRLGQVLRVVIIPANFGNKSTVDLKNYKEVISQFKIDESKIFKVKM